MLMAPTHQWFSENVLPYRFDSLAQCPQWLAFLIDVCSGDSELIALLQEFFGYCLTDDTSQQKALLLSGPPRSGKGTIIRQLVRTIGDSNCASLRLASLGERFGLEALAGKTVAVCPDAHLGRSSDHVGVLERLKSIIGEDPQSIDRKFREPIPNVRLRVRFVLAVNQFPDLPDSSVAMRSRLLMLPMNKSYEGREDRTLDDRLSRETPGVMVWALEGLKRLREQGKFTEPAASREILSEFARLSSPVLAFVEDWCRVDVADPHLWVECEAVWSHWLRWCRKTGESAGNKETFGANLRSAVPGVRRVRPRKDDGSRFYAYSGIGLTVNPACSEGGEDVE
jgi:putative DNA primase/helicase